MHIAKSITFVIKRSEAITSWEQAVLDQGFAIVADIGKTLSKLTLWSRDGRCLERLVRPNATCRPAPPELPYVPLDHDGIAAWLIDGLKQFAGHPVEAIIPVSHGAAVAGIRGDAPAFPPPDYEWEPPAQLVADYRAQRDAFAVSRSPALPAGLNLGMQLHYLEATRAGGLEGVTLMPLAQYWAWLFSGVAVSEVTSLGCHSDLWSPAVGDFSPMARMRGWAQRFAPLARAGDAIGTLRPELAAATGLSPQVRVHAGLHDSNAALHAARGFAEISGQEATVLSTGTWFIAMRLCQRLPDLAALSAERDCMVNIDVHGQPVPSGRFMGGREIESVIGIDTRRVDIVLDQPALLAVVPRVLARAAMLLPGRVPGCGPYPQGSGRWIAEPDDWYEKRAAMCLYAALVTETTLGLIGSRGSLLVEGRFAEAQVFVRALASLRPDMAVHTANAHNDVSFGALRLLLPGLRPQGELVRVEPLEGDLAAYRRRWHAEIHQGESRNG